MASILDRLTGVFSRQSQKIAQLQEELLAKQEQLTNALANDAADAETIANARAELEVAQAAAAEAREQADALTARVSELQSAVDNSTAELSALEAFAGQLEAMSPPPAPVEPTPEA